jgi:K+-sensing histidine kinase KdpD
MFGTVRDWWGNGRGKLTARLFVFELFVVVAGVLIAQALAGYVQQRSDFARMQSERARVRYELTTVHSAFRSWQAAVPCLARRMSEIMQGSALASVDLRRPQLQTAFLALPSTEVLDLIAKHHSVEEKNRLNWVAQNITNSSAVITSIITTWGRLTLIDPANGAVTAADRAQARIAAADIKAQLRAMEVLSKDANSTLTKMGVVARNQNEPEYGPAETCAAIWRSGRLDPPLEAR